MVWNRRDTWDDPLFPTTGVFSVKVFCTKCTEEEFVIGQMLRSSGMDLLYLLFLEGGRGCRCTKFEVNRTTIE
jgi:hypothetical protein